jgi:hypothetical protein
VHQRLVTVNGIFRPFALVGGRAAATWRIVAGKITLEPFAGLSEHDAVGLRADGEEVLRYLGL